MAFTFKDVDSIHTQLTRVTIKLNGITWGDRYWANVDKLSQHFSGSYTAASVDE